MIRSAERKMEKEINEKDHTHPDMLKMIFKVYAKIH